MSKSLLVQINLLDSLFSTPSLCCLPTYTWERLHAIEPCAGYRRHFYPGVRWALSVPLFNDCEVTSIPIENTKRQEDCSVLVLLSTLRYLG